MAIEDWSDTESHRSDDTYNPGDSGDDAFKNHDPHPRPSSVSCTPQKRRKGATGFRAGCDSLQPEPSSKGDSPTTRSRNNARKNRAKKTDKLKADQIQCKVAEARIAELEPSLKALRLQAKANAEELIELNEYIIRLEGGVQRLGLGPRLA